MRYIQSFSTSGDVQTAIDNGSLGKPYVAYIESDGAIDWNTKFIDYSNMPLTFKITSDGILKIYNSAYSISKYSINGADEVVLDSNATVDLNVVNGDTVVYKISNWGKYYRAFKNSTAGFTVYGNPKFGVQNIDGFDFREAFYGCTGLTDASNLILSETSLQSSCYSQMFFGCTSLTTAPSILPATTLASSCYSQMFFGCTSLTTAPELPATTLTKGCYQNMFNGCSSLNYIKCLATDISASSCTYSWVSNVSSTGTFVKNASMSSWTTGSDGIPTNWTVQDA